MYEYAGFLFISEQRNEPCPSNWEIDAGRKVEMEKKTLSILVDPCIYQIDKAAEKMFCQ